MFTLVESLYSNEILDRPDLGCAMLIAACQARGIKTTLIKGQTTYLKDIFIDESEELWDILRELKDADLRKIGILEYKESFAGKDMKQFCVELKGLYGCSIADKNPRRYFNGLEMKRFHILYNIFMSAYYYCLEELKSNKSRMVDNYVRRIRETNPRYIGFSLQFKFDSFSRAIRKRVKESLGIPIIAGGSLSPFIDLKNIDKILKKEYFDYLIVGPGEFALPRLIEALAAGREPVGIGNVYYARNGRIKGSGLEVINNLDSLPYPDFSQFDLDLYPVPERVLPIQSARGCSWGRCAFCSFHKINAGRHKILSADNFIATLAYLSNKYRCHFFTLNQEELTVEQAGIISKALLGGNLKNINISSAARLEKGYDNASLLRLMRKAGFIQLQWGVESASQRVLDAMRKGTNTRVMSRILKKSSQCGISNICFIFFGFPGETKVEARHTVAYLKKYARYIDDIYCGTFILTPYSPVGQNPSRWNVEICNPAGYTVKSGMNPKEVSIFYARFLKEIAMNNIKVSSGRLICLYPGNSRVTAHFLSSGHGMVLSEVALKCLARKRLNRIFPVLPGEFRKRGGDFVWRAENTMESIFINEHFPEKENTLDSLEEKMFLLSDGTMSIKDIDLIVRDGVRSYHSKKRLRDKCIGFFRKIFSRNLGMAFVAPWRAG